MALEDSVVRLARAVEAQGEATAVREIIRERDLARKELATRTSDRDWYQRRLSQEEESSRRMARRIAALQGVITRMKRARAGVGDAKPNV